VQVLQDELKETVLEKLLEKNPIEIPTALIEQEKEAIGRELSRQRRANIPKENLETEEVALQAKRRVELGLLLNEVITVNNLKADPQRVRAEIEKIAAKFSQSPEIVEAYYKSNELLYGVERVVLLDQAVETILKEANVKEKTATFDEVMNPV
jgi:trigger factor